VLSVVLIGVASALGELVAEPPTDTSAPDGQLVGELAVLSVAIGVLIVAAILTARWIDRRPAGTLASVEGRMRWRWLLICFAVCTAVEAPLGVVVLLVDPPDGGLGGVDWGLVAVVAAVSVVLVPFQAAGEEYLFRGYLAQAVGAVVASPWIPAVVLSLLFGLAHGTEQGTWLFVDRAVFGLIAAWLALRTGGLEAPIALHAVGNVAGYVLVTVDGELATAVVGPEPVAEPLEVAIDLALVLALAVLLVWLQGRARRRTRRPDRDATVEAPAQAQR